MAAFRGKGEDPYNHKYFHGRITREDAEERLKEQGSGNGLFLLREKLNESGCYALSLCFNHTVYHYSLQKKKNGLIAIEDGKQFLGPVELIQHHQMQQDGLLTKLGKPCNLLPGQQPTTFEGMTRDQLHQSIKQFARETGLPNAPPEQLESQVIKLMHLQKPWFHGCISRDEAEGVIQRSGHQDGKYLVRERDAGGSFAIGLSYRNTAYHYKVDKNDRTGKFSIQDGQKFDSLFQMVDHYSKKKDGLLCELTIPIEKGKSKSKIPPPIPALPPEGPLDMPVRSVPPLPDAASPGRSSPRIVPRNPIHGDVRPISTPPGSNGHFPMPTDHNVLPSQLHASPRHSPIPPRISDAALPSSPKEVLPRSPNDRGIDGKVTNASWDDEPDTGPSLPTRPLPVPPPPRPGAEEEIYGSGASTAEKIYDFVAKKKKTTTLDYRNLTLMSALGKGNFGSVVKGEYITNGQRVPVAVKTLKEEEKIPNKKSEIMKEAEFMAKLDHPYIVRMIGMCENPDGVMMLVLELAELGPLNKYLKEKQNMRIRNILEILLQVAMGMDYLEGQQFVHRDLAARNVLLVTETFAKISDFGMSKALGLDSQYYVAETAGKWPLKWYAPECIYRFKFSSKGDVWSFGVTMWEALSFGKKPYARMKGQQILDLLESGQRLDKPEKCPEEVYEVMKKCWTFESRSRPNFKEVVALMKGVLSKVRKGQIRLVQ